MQPGPAAAAGVRAGGGGGRPVRGMRSVESGAERGSPRCVGLGAGRQATHAHTERGWLGGAEVVE